MRDGRVKVISVKNIQKSIQKSSKRTTNLQNTIIHMRI